MTPKIIDAFLGVNKRETDTLLRLGEASDMTNWIITDDLKLKKMHGYAKLFATLGAHKINGMWYGTLSGTDYFLFACNGHVYECDLSTNTNTDLGTLADAYPTTFWVTNNTVYIMDGTEFYSWSGSGSIATVTGYTPTVLTASPPSGGGTILEAMNYISGQKIQKFSADGVASLFQLAEYDVDSIDSVYYNGVLQTVTTDYTVNLTNGTVTFVSVPTTGANNVVITWTKVEAGNRELITNNRYYGGTYYARYWLFGNPNHKNTRYVSGVTMAGSSDPTYWPMFTDSDVGENEITDICIQYNKQIIFTSGDSEASAWYSEPSTYTDESTGIITTIFPVYPINSKVGNVSKGQVQVIGNYPFTIWKGIYEWRSTYVVNEKDSNWISSRIQTDLDAVDLSTALAIDWPDRGQYWVCVEKKVWILNYRVTLPDGISGAWSILELAHTPTCFLVADADLYFGTDAGLIMKVDETLGTYDGKTITATWDSGYHTFGADWVKKFIQYMLVSILPLVETHVDIYVSTDVNAPFRQLDSVSYSLSGFDTWDFETFSFETAYSPQPRRRTVGAKDITYIKIRFVNDGTDGAVVLSMTLPVYEAGEVNRR